MPVPFRCAAVLLTSGLLCACAPSASQPPLSINSPKLDSGIRGSGGDGLGGERVVGKPVGGAGTINRVPAP